MPHALALFLRLSRCVRNLLNILPDYSSLLLGLITGCEPVAALVGIRLLTCLVDSIKFSERRPGPIDGYPSKVDLPWLEKQIYTLEEEVDLRNQQGQEGQGATANALDIFTDQSLDRCAGAVIIAEPSQARWIMSAPPFPQGRGIPRETQIFRMKRGMSGGWQRVFEGNYTAKSAIRANNIAPAPLSIGSRRAPSPSLTNDSAKRRKGPTSESASNTEVHNNESDIDGESSV